MEDKYAVFYPDMHDRCVQVGESQGRAKEGDRFIVGIIRTYVLVCFF